MKMHQAILVLVCAFFLGSCTTTHQGSTRRPPGFRSHTDVAPPSQTQSPEAPQGAPPNPVAAISTPEPASETTATKSDDSKKKSAEPASHTKTKTPPLPSFTGKFESGLLSIPSKEKAQAQTFPGGERQRIVLNFEKADISEVTAQIFGDYLKLNYVLDPTLQGRVSLYLEGEYTKEELFQMITKAYEANNASIVPRNGIYYIQPVQRSSSSSLPVANTITLQPDKEGVRPVIVMYRLRYMDVKQAINTIKFFLSPGRPITSDSMTNSIIFVEDTDNAQTIVSVLQSLDIDILKEVSMEVVPLKSLSPQDAVQSMEALFSKLDIFKDSAIKSNVAYIPLQNFGGVLVLARNPDIIKTAKQWLMALDIQSAESGEQIYVYFVQNGLAVDIANILSQVFGLKGGGETSRPEQKIVSSTSAFGSSSRPFGSSSSGSSSFGSRSSFGSSLGSSSMGSSSSGFSSSGSSSSPSAFGSSSSTGSAFGTYSGRSSGTRSGATSTGGRSTLATRAGQGTSLMPSGLTGEVIIIPDEVNNAIVVRSNATDYAKIKKTIETLDILPRAVLIEVTLAEVTLNKNFAYGLQWFFRSKEFQTSFGNTLLSSGTTTNADGTTTNNRRFDFAQLAGQGLNLFFLSNSRDFAALINFLSTKTEVNILSTPTLLATDNKEASIQVGGREPVPTGSITGGTTGSDVISTIQYEETGIILNVTPHINAGGLVRLEVEQTDRRTNQVAATVGNNNTAPTFTERNIKTTLLAQSGSTIVIGGIIQQQQTDTRDGIPFLEDIPIISPLFSTKGRSTARTELIIAITPHVVDHRESAVTREFLDKLKQLRREVGRP